MKKLLLAFLGACVAGQPTDPPDPPVQTDPYFLGAVPFEVRWPDKPQIERTVQVNNKLAFDAAVEKPNTKIEITSSIDADLYIPSSDIELVLLPGVVVRKIKFNRSLRRISITGGQMEMIDLPMPIDFNTNPWTYHEDWMIQDVMINAVTIKNPIGPTMGLRGKRVAVLRSKLYAHSYCLWAGDTGSYNNENPIIAGNIMVSDGPESTLRMYQATNSIVVDNRLENPNKNTYRIHGTSFNNFFARNVLIGNGAMVGSMPGDHLGTQWFSSNTWYHSVDNIINYHMDKIDQMIVENNTAYSNVWGCFLCIRPPTTLPIGWIEVNNFVKPYQAPPPRESSWGN